MATERELHLDGEIHPDAGVPHGHVASNGEKVVYIWDEDGNFVEWAKEPVGGFVEDPTVRPRNEDQTPEEDV